MLLDAGETETLNANWTYHQTEDAGLDCYVEEPFQFIDASPFITQGSASSTRDGADATVSWNSVDEDSSAAIILLIAIVLTVIIGVVVAVRLASAGTNGREIDYEVADDDRVDRFADERALAAADGLIPPIVLCIRTQHGDTASSDA